MQLQKEITVLGSGSWGTAQVKLLTENGHKVRWWMRRQDEVDFVAKNGYNRNYLSDVRLNKTAIYPTADINEAIAGADVVFLVIPSAFVKDALAHLAPGALCAKLVVSGVKGIIPGQNIVVTDYLEQFCQVPAVQQAIIAGPCHAEEIAMAKQSYLTIGATNLDTSYTVSALLQNSYVKCTPSTDLYGLEYSAILKNIVAIACGIAHGLRYGDNFLAVLVANALQEIENYISACYPLAGRRIADSGYTGDVLVTAYSQFSRNRTFGTMLGRGYSVQAAHLEMNMVAEGYYASKCIQEGKKALALAMPVVDTTYQILYEKKPAAQAFAQLAEVLS